MHVLFKQKSHSKHNQTVVNSLDKVQFDYLWVSLPLSEGNLAYDIKAVIRCMLLLGLDLYDKGEDISESNAIYLYY